MAWLPSICYGTSKDSFVKTNVRARGVTWKQLRPKAFFPREDAMLFLYIRVDFSVIAWAVK